MKGNRVINVTWKRRVLASVIGAAALAGIAGGGSIASNAGLMPLLRAEVAAAPVESAAAPSAARSLDLRLSSQSLGKEMGYSVYLPPGYDSSPDARYPVLYMLHGLGGHQRTWQDDGLFATATSMILNGEIEPMIIVTPEGERGYWIDHANNGPRYASYITRDLISRIDADYRTEPQRQSRAIGGMSMGAHGALQLALNNPEKFAIVGAHSLALRNKEQAFPFFGDRQYFEAHDPVSLSKNDPGDAARTVIWIDIGTRDVWLDAAQAFHRQLTAQNLPHLWSVRPGGHDDAYWTANAATYLRFYNQAFAAPGALFELTTN